MRLIAHAAAAALMMGALATAGSAHADTDSPPVTVNDSATIRQYDFAAVDVLKNDSDPDGDSLAVCRLGNDVPDQLFVDIEDDEVYVAAEKPGVYTFTYYACDYSYLTPGTVTVTVKRVPPIRMAVTKSKHRPGMFKVRNRSSFPIMFEWGSYKAKKEDAHVRLKPHTWRWVHVHRVSVIWIAFNQHNEAFRIGILRGITLPAGMHALPPGAPPKHPSTGHGSARSGETSSSLLAAIRGARRW